MRIGPFVFRWDPTTWKLRRKAAKRFREMRHQRAIRFAAEKNTLAHYAAIITEDEERREWQRNWAQRGDGKSYHRNLTPQETTGFGKTLDSDRMYGALLRQYDLVCQHPECGHGRSLHTGYGLTSRCLHEQCSCMRFWP